MIALKVNGRVQVYMTDDAPAVQRNPEYPDFICRDIAETLAAFELATDACGLAHGKAVAIEAPPVPLAQYALGI